MQMRHDKTKPKTGHMMQMGKKHTQKQGFTEQVSRTSCDNDTIESMEKEKEDFQFQDCSFLVTLISSTAEESNPYRLFNDRVILITLCIFLSLQASLTHKHTD